MKRYTERIRIAATRHYDRNWFNVEAMRGLDSGKLVTELRIEIPKMYLFTYWALLGIDEYATNTAYSFRDITFVQKRNTKGGYVVLVNTEYISEATSLELLVNELMDAIEKAITDEEGKE